MVLYDQMEALYQPNQLVKRMMLAGGEVVVWVVNFWQFDMLRLKSGLECYKALEAAADADLVVITICDPMASTEMPVEWLEHWAILRRFRNAKVVVMATEIAVESPKIAQRVEELRRVATRHDMTLLTFNSTPPRELGELIQELRRVDALRQPDEYLSESCVPA